MRRKRSATDPHVAKDGSKEPAGDGGAVRLVFACTALGLIWLAVLPLIGRQPRIAARIEEQNARGINPGAMYYTELKAMPPIARRVDRRREANRDAFWRWPPRPFNSP